MEPIANTSEVSAAKGEENAVETNKEAINVLIYSPTNDQQKQELADAIFYAREMLIKTNFISKTVSSEISNRSMLIGKKMFKRFMQMFGEMEFTDEMVLNFGTDASIPLQKKSTNERESPPPCYEEKREPYEIVPFSTKLKAVQLAELHPKWSIATLGRHSTSLLTNKKQLARWKAHVKKGGTQYDKYEIINSNVYDRFLKAKENESVPVTCRLLQQWAMDARAQIIDPHFNFIASNTWVNNFKRKYGISLRHVTKSACNEKKE